MMQRDEAKQEMIKQSPLHNCLMPLLRWLKWDGKPRELHESVPHLRTMQSIEDFRWTMQNLGFKSDVVFLNLNEIDDRLLPCLFIPDQGSPKVLNEIVGSSISIFDGETEQTSIMIDRDLKGCVVLFKKMGEEVIRHDPTKWFVNALVSRKSLLYYVGFLNFLQALLTLAPSIFVISIYDKVVTTGSYNMLVTFSIGILMAMFFLAIIMMVRFRLLAHVGAYIQRHIGNTIFQQLLKLPPVYTESAPVGTQIARLNDFNSVRDFFSNPLFGTLIELPFLLIYLAAVWIIGGILVLVPVVAIMISLLIGVVVWRYSRKNIRESAVIQARQQDFLVESLWGMRSLQYAGLQKKWKERFRDVNGEATLHSRSLQLSGNTSDAVFDMLMILSGLATLIIGTLLVIDNQIQVGALIGVMFVIWRILAPVKAVNVMLPKLIQLNRSIGQINDLMRITPEQRIDQEKHGVSDNIVGAVSFSQVSFRYPGSEISALIDINFSLKPGQMLVLIGPSAAGKSTIGNLILAMYLPQAGRVYIDGRNIKQYDHGVLRTHIAYVPQKAELFYGTIAQNLLLSDPTATMDRLIEAAKAANLFKDIESLAEGFNTRIRDYGDKALGESFCQKLNLARAYLRNSTIMIMDEPETSLDPESARVMMQFLQKIKGKKTIVLVSNLEAHVRLADFAMVIYDGKQMMLDQPDKVWTYAKSINLVQ